MTAEQEHSLSEGTAPATAAEAGRQGGEGAESEASLGPPPQPEAAVLELEDEAEEGIDPAQGQPATGYHVLNDPVVYVVIFVGSLLTTGLPVFLGQRFCLPLLNALVVFPLFVWAVRVSRPRRAITLGLFWALSQTVAFLAMALLLSERATVTVLNGLDFRTEMLAWIATGSGAPGAPGQFLPRELGNVALFAGASLLTAGLGSFILLALALNMINLYVASLVQQATNPLLLALTAWPIWLIVRLAGYLMSAAVLAEPAAVLDLRPQWWAGWWRRRRRLLAIGIGIVLLSFLLQALLAPIWDDLLRAATGLS